MISAIEEYLSENSVGTHTDATAKVTATFHSDIIMLGLSIEGNLTGNNVSLAPNCFLCQR